MERVVLAHKDLLDHEVHRARMGSPVSMVIQVKTVHVVEMEFIYLHHLRALMLVKSAHQVLQARPGYQALKDVVAIPAYRDNQDAEESQIDLVHRDHQVYVENPALLDRKGQLVIAAKY